MLSYHNSCQSCFHLENNLISIGSQDRLFFFSTGYKRQYKMDAVRFLEKANKKPYKSAYKLCVFPSVNFLKNNSLILLASEMKIRMFCICMEWITGQNLAVMNCYVENDRIQCMSICHNFSVQSPYTLLL